MAELTVNSIKKLTYERPAIAKGYANQTLQIDLSNTDIDIKPVSEDMKKLFVLFLPLR